MECKSNGKHVGQWSEIKWHNASTTKPVKMHKNGTENGGEGGRGYVSGIENKWKCNENEWKMKN